MSEPIAAIIVGLGTHGRSTARLAAEAGVRILGAVDPATAGRSLAEVAGGQTSPNVVVSASFDEIPKDVLGQAQIVVLAALLPPAQLIDLTVGILEQSLNVITIVEFLFDAETLDPVSRNRIDTAARDNGVSFVATGAQDIAWSGLIIHLTGAVRRLKSVSIVQRLGVDGYPARFLRDECGVAVPEHEFAEVVAGIMALPSVLGAVLPVMAREMGLHPGVPRRSITAVTSHEALPSATFGRDLVPGESIGIRDEVAIDTAEGVTFTAELVTTAHQPGAQDVFASVLDAEPRFELSHTMLPGPLCVDATVINRLADTIAARPGIVPAAHLPRPAYRHEAGALREDIVLSLAD